MGKGYSVLRFLLPLVVIVIGGYVARHAFSEGMQTVIAAQPGPAKPESETFTPLPGCQLDAKLQYANPLQCRMETRAAGDEYPLVFHAKPIKSMTKAQSETASGWFQLAVFAVPLSLIVAALFGFLLFRLPSGE
ncbi:MAG TPA: hypothetical protein VHW69_17175 [Rhizomicrobium sp.]|jgi:hypothetical protein|nr:hypothetical protein [Rhizomicrobium sp.]